jgi:enoyl-CoA hydratase/carnithine racemase
MKKITHMLEEVQQHSGILCVLMRHEGSWFSSGHDVHDLFNKEDNYNARPREQLKDVFRTCSQLNIKLKSLSKPTVAIVEGHASAGGLQLVASCDIVVAAKNLAKFSAPGSQRGRFCHTPAVALLDRVGRKKALEMLLLGSVWNATEAQQAGLVNFVVPDTQVEEKATEIGLTLSRASPNIQTGKMGFLKQLEMADEGVGIADRYNFAEALMVDMFCTPDAAEGTRAMVEKCEPKWKLEATDL